MRPLTLLTGINGLGKSSILQSLLSLRQSYKQGLLQNDELDLNGELTRLGTGRDILFEGAQNDEVVFELEIGEEAATLAIFL